jgi:hypothetical protein
LVELVARVVHDVDGRRLSVTGDRISGELVELDWERGEAVVAQLEQLGVWRHFVDEADQSAGGYLAG